MKLPEDGFKFNCGFDICTYPIQYCDTEDKRCGYCSPDICNSDSIPTQCIAECNRLFSTSSASPGDVQRDLQMNNYSAYTGTSVEGAYFIAILALILVLCLYVKKVWKLYRKRGKRNKSYTPLEVVKTKICIEPIKATYGILNQNEPGNQETPSTPEIPNPTEQATVPPQENMHEPSSPSYTDSTILAHPDDADKSPSHNFGDHNILPSSLSLEESIQGPHTIGPVSQAQNEKKCEQLDYNILDSSEHFTKGIQDVTKHSANVTDNVNACTGSLGFDINKAELTIAKEQTDKVC
ncbi:Hypothetical predicted protein [Mytilus galloprovincialis]|uniref:Uncharacterized protein n=1 Tax=Mytilus galloprovincialis TaxID=29158 RepID=A0A8B6CHQ9_MYTGA|nr:Hypothetical predicted protein [Mytilus galloprovincialis]